VERAIVLGGSLAGLLSARALAEHVDEVVIIERDRISDAPGPRRGVPQARHLHGLLKRGELVIDGLFPGIAQALLDAGAVPVRFCADVRWYHHGNWKVQAGDGVVAKFMSRSLLEDEVRGRALRHPRIRLLEECSAQQLLATGDRRVVTGVRYRPATASHGDGDGLPRLDADLVVDATGRGTRAVAWLRALGYGEPPASTVGINVGYSSQILRLHDPDSLGAKAMIIVPRPAQRTRAAALMPIEGGRWLCSAAGFVGDHPPRDRADFLRFVAELPTPALHHAIHDAEPLTPIAHLRFPENRWTHFERMKRFPDRFVVVGDAVGCFNPVYGQGMTAAALTAEALGRFVASGALAPQHDGSTLRLRRQIAKIVKHVWMMSASEDLNYPGVEGSRPPGHAALRWYLGKVHSATATDPVALDGFLRVGHMLAPPSALMRPGYAVRVLTTGKRAGQKNETPPAHVLPVKEPTPHGSIGPHDGPDVSDPNLSR
jgi:2-polyprenyl-6-methoxyphenol hydroxylase-like FAD-dependent oxidoreductase